MFSGIHQNYRYPRDRSFHLVCWKRFLSARRMRQGSGLKITEAYGKMHEENVGKRMRQRRTQKLRILILLSLLFITCEQNKTPLAAKADQIQEYPSHEFEWTADTLAPPDAFQVYMYDIWGTDENNVWCVGHSDLNKYQIWHWNGNQWRNVETHIMGERPSYFEIFGFSENDFWIAGYTSIYNGYLLHFDGEWHRMDNNELATCLSLWGSSSQNLYIGCNQGIIYRYDGDHFTKYETGKNLQFTTIWGLQSGEIFAIGVNTENQPAEPPIRYLFKYDTDKFTLLDSVVRVTPYVETIGMDLWGTDINNLYSPTGNSLTKYANGEWVTQFYAALYRVFGSSSYNIFTGGYYNRIYHYNGIDWAEVYPGSEELGGMWGVWCNDEHVFLIQHPAYFTRILRGKQMRP
ncbi:MAG: hypothetical protein P8184_16290 [Calditrichia bacterium]